MTDWNKNIFLDDLWEKVSNKLNRTVEKYGDRQFIYTTVNGKFVEHADKYFWTNGFWCGMNWLMYLATKEQKYLQTAKGLVKKLDEALHGFVGLHHDVGFMYLLSAVADYRITGCEESKIRGMHAATLLAGRFNVAGNFFRAWNDDPAEEGSPHSGWAIIDCMMNIPLLYWASYRFVYNSPT